MLVIVVRERGRLDSLCFVRLLNDVPGSVYTKVRDPLLVFSFSFGVVCLMIMVLAARTFGSR